MLLRFLALVLAGSALAGCPDSKATGSGPGAPSEAVKGNAAPAPSAKAAEAPAKKQDDDQGGW